MFGGFIAFQVLRNGRELMTDMAGFARQAPFAALAMMCGLFSLAGMPLFAGFVTKFYLFAAIARAGLLWLVAIAVINSTISLYYYLLLVHQMYAHPAGVRRGGGQRPRPRRPAGGDPRSGARPGRPRRRLRRRRGRGDAQQRRRRRQRPATGAGGSNGFGVRRANGQPSGVRHLLLGAAGRRRRARSRRRRRARRWARGRARGRCAGRALVAPQHHRGHAPGAQLPAPGGALLHHPGAGDLPGGRVFFVGLWPAPLIDLLQGASQSLFAS